MSRSSRPTQEVAVAAVNAAVHIHGRDFATIRAAIRDVAAENDGMVDPNLVRARLLDKHGDLIVNPRALSAQYGALKNRGILARAGMTINQDVAGGNRGKPMHVYRLVDPASLDEAPEPAPDPVPAPEPDPEPFVSPDAPTLLRPEKACGTPSVFGFLVSPGGGDAA